ncbi:MAG: hemerythrin family protein [Terracidiphilus sp.]
MRPEVTGRLIPKSHAGTTIAPLRVSAAGLDLALVVEEDVTQLTWSHECIVGVQAMDDQHGILMDSLNELRLMLLRGADRRAICLQLERLIDFTQMHFQCEEQLLSQQGFPGVNDHQAAHRLLLTKLYGALEQLTHDEFDHFSSVLDFLPGWYLQHLEQLDQPYGIWLNEHGVY